MGVAILLACGWLTALSFGFDDLMREEFTPVASLPLPSTFPPASHFHLDPKYPTLFLFLHPYCPCSRASLHELDRLLATIRQRAAVNIVFTLPAGLEPGWEQSALWQTAATMPGTTVLVDAEGVETTRLGVRGSGHALLYLPSGELLFSGGITASRGHEGDNPGCAALEDFILTGHATVSRFPVFGCSFF